MRFKHILILILLFTIYSCSTLKNKTNNSVYEKEKTELKTDSTSVVKINKAINDNIKTKINKSGNNEIDAKIDKILANLNTFKKSGDNSYKLYYDEKARELRAEFEIGKTQDSISKSSVSEKTEKSFEENMQEYIKKATIPFWVWLLLIILFLPSIKTILQIAFPIVSTIIKQTAIKK